jgi:hypothetical protein
VPTGKLALVVPNREMLLPDSVSMVLGRRYRMTSLRRFIFGGAPISGSRHERAVAVKQKAKELFDQHKPDLVVARIALTSTGFGGEDLSVCHNVHVLPADTPDEPTVTGLSYSSINE